MLAMSHRQVVKALLIHNAGLDLRSSTRTPNRQHPEYPSGMTRITFEVADEHAPALRSAVEEFSNILGTRLEGAHSFAKEQALTDAVICVGTMRAAVNRAVPKGDANYA